ncbi:tRNA (adenosine(37)-N6)-threonylcarbamoyltransferase complex dimerization subunit type 1 TsaB [Novosphingobium sp. KACC 22771]|uniref:tRNA (adenosine(37)-N6)-threonylcarbamoyltransferase complex dimerization subunit type 1 TsaB n=1 Tax=Novosphingobium sp. KACC 22771 TaxID=3025670 RepID=UPI0023654AD8|nr:tRNA (adenosine(37)-N6)-threonylcarbamoyltransferase complex dimerization subunit type 1 TsaB [Novosphingobium sp. KACC 22771]WDF73820.1 tRNA (adenosine(37)-N6)-threonylcarbamoyltransferase complex dimerization subunit type 1 TsaB [Novosphingobium sp. KACC 22771]
MNTSKSGPDPRIGRWLAIECTTEACSVALFQDGAMVAGEYRQLGRGHAEALVPMIAALPDRGRAEAIAVGRGPGSFTGLRIGLAAARALGLAWGAPVYGYPTLALIAAMALGRGTGPVRVATTGGHGEWFTQGFDAVGQALGDLLSQRPEDAMTHGEALIAGSQAEALLNGRRAAGGPDGLALALWPDARAVAGLHPDHFSQDLTPLYGRAPDARLPGGRLPATSAA